MVAQGKMSQAEFDKWQAETPANIPDRVSGGPIKKIKKAKKI
jgi:hypothetical protein